MKPILELKNIDKRFGAVHALKEVSLSIREGEMIALAGENGAGKSTLMKILTGAYAKDSGEVWFEGRKEMCIRDRCLPFPVPNWYTIFLRSSRSASAKSSACSRSTARQS